MNILYCGGFQKSRALKKVQQERRGDLDPVTSCSGVGKVLSAAASVRC